MVELICYNIEYCGGLQGRWYEYLNIIRELFFPPKGLDQRIVDALKELNPDILGLVEVDTGSIRAKKDEAVFFRNGLQMKSFDEAVKYVDRGMGWFYSKLPIMRKQAIALLSKYDLMNVKHHVLSRGVKRIVVEATIKVPKKVTLLLAHLALGKKTRKVQIQELIKIVNSIDNPVILMGDFNTFKGESEIKELLMKTQLRHGTKIQSDRMAYTQPTFKPTKVLDYILTSKQIKVNKYQVLPMSFSDHLPVLADFEVV